MGQPRTYPARRAPRIITVVALLASVGAQVAEAQPPPTPAPGATPEPPAPAAVPSPAPSVVAAPAAQTSAPADVPPPAGPVAQAAAPAAAPATIPGIPTADAKPAESDHDAVVGHWGIQTRRIEAAPYPFVLRPALGCPTTAPPEACSVELAMISVRRWTNRNLAWNAGGVLAFGGGSEASRNLDTHMGIGALGGLTLLIGNWKHLAIGASPELAVVMFRPGGQSATSTFLVTFRAELEAELHFGFIGVPALSVGLASGLVFAIQRAPEATVWSIAPAGPTTPWGTLTSLFLRYYL